MSIARLATAGLLLLQLAACASVQSLERPHTVALPMPADVAARFDYEAGDVRAELSLARENATYRVFDGEFSPDIDKNKVAVFGASLGGFNALFLTAADTRVKASAFALVGGER